MRLAGAIAGVVGRSVSGLSMTRVALACAAGVALAGCVSSEEQAKAAAAREEAGVLVRPGNLSRDQAFAALVNKTRVTPALRGSQVSYLAPDGSVYLWFPGNDAILRGRWRIEATGGYVQALGRPVERYAICFDYDGPRPSFLAGDAARQNCAPVETVLRRAESTHGDVLGLARRARVPFVLSSQPLTLRELQERLGRG